VSIWARGDPVFREAVAAARRRADWMRRFAFDEAKAAAFLARVAAGERVTDLLGAPGMPGHATYRYWRRSRRRSLGWATALCPRAVTLTPRVPRPPDQGRPLGLAGAA
jgi:hypothetical protein